MPAAPQVGDGTEEGDLPAPRAGLHLTAGVQRQVTHGLRVVLNLGLALRAFSSLLRGCAGVLAGRTAHNTPARHVHLEALRHGRAGRG